MDEEKIREIVRDEVGEVILERIVDILLRDRSALAEIMCKIRSKLNEIVNCEQKREREDE